MNIGAVRKKLEKASKPARDNIEPWVLSGDREMGVETSRDRASDWDFWKVVPKLTGTT